MLRQLARLQRPVPRAGRTAIAIAVYADERDRLVPARETGGHEGVACVDDAARALALYLALWRRAAVPWLRDVAQGLLDFLLYMEVAPGRYANFILDWDGARNLDGPTSGPDGAFWNARALFGLAAASAAGIERAREPFERALRDADARRVAADIRAIEVRALLELPDGSGGRERLARWCDEIAACRRGDLILDNPDETEPHLWAHAQESVLARSGQLLGRSDLVDLARRSAENLFVPLIGSGFALPVVQPDAVANAVHAMDALAGATRDPRYVELAELARAWFAGRNTARRPVYDEARGRVADGIDAGILNPRSGAEANIVAAEVMRELRVPPERPRA